MCMKTKRQQTMYIQQGKTDKLFATQIRYHSKIKERKKLIRTCNLTRIYSKEGTHFAS